MDKEWMKENKLSKEYEEGVEYFMEFAIKNGDDPNMIPCPCVMCRNFKKLSGVDVRVHLYKFGIDSSYKNWIWHGERVTRPNSSKRARREHVLNNNFHIDMFNNVEENFAERPYEIVRLIEESEKPIYPGSKVTKMSLLVRMYNLKARNRWSDNGFSQLLSYMCEIFPEGNNIPCSTYEAKKVLRSLGMENEFSKASNCPVCKYSRWKLNDNGKELKIGTPAKLLWYIPPIPRFKQLFHNPEHSKSLVRHDEERIKDGKLRHPADSPSWKKIDDMYRKLFSDPRNLCLGLSADGINPHSSMSSNYSCWPVNLVIYSYFPSFSALAAFVEAMAKTRSKRGEN
ncbi:hypothetical protein CsatA_023004 [Cannabis sativa]